MTFVDSENIFFFAVESDLFKPCLKLFKKPIEMPLRRQKTHLRGLPLRTHSSSYMMFLESGNAFFGYISKVC